MAAPKIFTPEFVARAHHVSLRLGQKLFAGDGDSPAAYIRRHRLEAARRLLLSGEPVHRAGHRTGFCDIDTFSRAFKREFGAPPSATRARSAGPLAETLGVDDQDRPG